MTRCPNGHDSTTDDYCDVCGVPISAGTGSPAAAASAGSAPSGPASSGPASSAAGSDTCPNCGQPMLGGARFCEQCGWDAEAATLGGSPLPPAAAPAPGTPAPAVPAPGAPAPAAPVPAAGGAAAPLPPGTWQLVAAADRAYFDTVLTMDGDDASTLTFPAYWPERRFPLTGEKVLIGRHSRSREAVPEVDLGGQFTDPGVSHLHAVLVAQPAGGWTVADLGSSNGTYLNDHPDPLEPHVPVPVGANDRIHIGAWTTLTLIPPTS